MVPDSRTSPPFALRDAAACRWDCVALGEVMLRFDPGAGRIRTARHFDVYEGGGEYNVARALRKAFGRRTAILTALPRNELGRLAEDLILQGGVDVSQVAWRAPSSSEPAARMGLNFVERGFGVRPALGCSDRAHSAAAQIGAGDFDWDAILGALGTRWFHTGGIFASLSDATFDATTAAMTAARRHGVVVSYDLNYRPSLWADRGGYAAAMDLTRRLLPLIDVLIGGFDDFAGLAQNPSPQGADAAGALARAFPNLKVLAATERETHSASRHSWGASLWSGNVFHHAETREMLDIYDRVGGGDGFASGMIHAFLEGLGPQAAVDYGAAHGALVMTTPGDGSMADVGEVQALIRGGGGRTQR
jgi:2-dehydro-3-deoxygluconokinase